MFTIFLRWSGPCLGQSGYEQLTRGLLISLDKLGVQIELDPARAWNQERIQIEGEERNRLLRMMNTKVPVGAIQICHQYPLYYEQYKKEGARKIVCYSLFETDRCPHPWLKFFKEIDKVWVFSEFNRKHWGKSFKDFGIDENKIDVIPFGIDSELFSPSHKSAEFLNKKGFAFITSGDFTERKNFEGLIEAYVKEFKAEEDVCLIIKTHYGGFTRRYQDDVVVRLKEIVARFIDKKRNPPRILYLPWKMPTEDLPSFYTAGNCFVLVSRGEGLGLPFIEAMACGLPIISTNWSAPRDYLNEGNSLPIQADIRQIDDITYIQRCPTALNHSWAHPYIEDLQSKMRWVYEFKDDAIKKGKQARKDMVERTWQKSALDIVKKIFEMGG